MKNAFSIALFTITTALTLTACGGGSSDSSGNYEFFNTDAYETPFRHLPNCTVDTVQKIIYAGKNNGNPRLSQLIPQECKVKLPELNGGLTFSLKCTMYNSSRLEYKANQRYKNQIETMLKSGNPYRVSCEN